MEILSFSLKQMNWMGLRNDLHKPGLYNLVFLVYVINTVWSAPLLIINCLDHINNPAAATDAISRALAVLFTVSKTVFFYRKRASIMSLIREWQEYIDKSPLKMRVIFEEADLNYRKIVKIYGYLLIIATINYVCVPYAHGLYETWEGKKETVLWEHPIPIYPFLVQTSPWYELIYLYIILSFAFVMAGIILSFFVLMGFSIFICAHFKNLNNMIMEMDNKLSAKEYQQAVKNCVDYNVAIFHYVDVAESCYQEIIMCQLLVCGVIMCCALFQLTAPDNEMFQTAIFAMFLIQQAYDLFFTCYYGNNITTASQTISEVIYSTKWYTRTPKERKMILLMLMRNQRLSYLTAMKFTTCSLNSFGEVIRFSCSLYAFFRHMQVKVEM